MKIAINRTDGGASLMTPIFPDLPMTDDERAEFIDTIVEQWKAAQPGQYISHHEIDESELPSSRTDRSRWGVVDGRLVADALPPTREHLKAARAEAVARITVTTSIGNTFDGDEDSQSRMSRAILISQATGQTETTWTLGDNSIVTVTSAELMEALALAGQQQSELWAIP